jgi:asparagine synthase (glutamine-hydrolysing)
MPGLVGFVSASAAPASEGLLARMARALEDAPRFQVDLHQEAAWGLGRVSLGILNPQPQPIWSADRNLGIVMEGELYDTRALRRDRQLATDSDAELLLQLYTEQGEACACQLNGAFTAAIWDRRAQKLTVLNDRLGLYPLYYARVDGRLLFASGVRALLADPVLSRDPDPIAIAQFLTFDHVLDDRTLLAAVRLLPQASILTFQDGRLAIHPYWRPQYSRAYPLQDEEAWMDQLMAHLRCAVTRQATDDRPAGLLLSGGLDSRVILALLAETKSRGRLHTFTWGIPGCDDARLARELAAQVGARHHFFELKPDWLIHKAAEAVRLTDGLGNVVNLHAYATLEEEAAHAQVLYKGFLGDAMMGFGLRYQFWGEYDEATWERAHLQVHRDQGVITFDPWAPDGHARLFSPEFQRQIGDGVMAAYRAGMRAAQSELLADQRCYFDLTQRVPRMTINGVEVVRSRVAVRLPFADNDLVAFTLTVPPGLRYERRLIKRAFARAYPALAKVPVTDTGLPLIACARDLWLRAARLAQWQLDARGIRWLTLARARPYKDYANWFRGVLRPWLEGFVLSERALARDYFRPEAVRQLVAEHMAGTNHTVRLGALLTIELWHRQLEGIDPQ